MTEEDDTDPVQESDNSDIDSDECECVGFNVPLDTS